MTSEPDMVKVKAKVNGKKSPGRKRRLTGWTLIALGLLVAAVWAASGWWAVSVASVSNAFSLAGGCLDFTKLAEWEPQISELDQVRRSRWDYDEETQRGWRLESLKSLGLSSPSWVFVSRRNLDPASTGVSLLIFSYETWLGPKGTPPGANRSASFVFWPIPLFLWAAGVPVLRSGIIARRRATRGSCVTCGYSLAGLLPGADAKCPECGKGAGTT